MYKSQKNAGNMLIYILGAIFLFGLLIVLLKGSFQEGTGIDAEKAMLRATQVQKYGAEVERAVNNILSNGKSETAIRFATNGGPAQYGVYTDDPTRQVFSDKGGGAELWNPPLDILIATSSKFTFHATTHIEDMGTDTPATQKAELVMTLQDVTPAFCQAINRLNGQNIDLSVSMDSSTNGVIAAGSGALFAGTYGYGTTVNRLNDALFTKRPAKEACILIYSGVLVYYRVLLAR